MYMLLLVYVIHFNFQKADSFISVNNEKYFFPRNALNYSNANRST